MPAALGEAVSAPKSCWQSALERMERLLGQHLLPVGVVWVPILGFGTLVVAGVVILTRRGAWLMVFIILASVGLVCMTPWPDQFTRYLVPLAPFLTIAAVSGLVPHRCRTAGAGTWSGDHSRTCGDSPASWCSPSSCRRPCCEVGVPCHQSADAISFVPGASDADAARFFFHDRSWRAWEEAVGLDRRARATRRDRRHEHLRTNAICSRAVVPCFQPMEIDPAQARRLLEAVPVSYVIVDELQLSHRLFASLCSPRSGEPPGILAPRAWNRWHADLRAHGWHAVKA